MMSPEVIDELNKPEVSEFHTKLRDHVLDLLRTSRNDMAEFYPQWDERHRVYKAQKLKDKKDREAERVKEPVKMVVPLTSAQIDTFVTFGIMTLLQRKDLFEFQPTGSEDYVKLNPAEKLVGRDMDVCNKVTILNQFLLDAAKFGLAAIQCHYVDEYDYVPIEVTEAPAKNLMGVEIAPTVKRVEWQKVLVRKGNKVFNVSPYRIFPDTRLPLSRYQEGDYFGFDVEETRMALKKQEASGMYAGVQYIQPLGVIDKEKHGSLPRLSRCRPGESDSVNVLRTEVFVDLVPKEWELENKVPLGAQDFPVRYLVTLANNDRVIRCEPYGALNRKFPIFVGQWNPDQHELVNDSLAGKVEKLQEVVDWFFNSRVASVTRTLDNQLVVDPSGLEMSTVNSKSRVIVMKKSAARQDPRRFVHQLQVNDVTANHLNDMDRVAQMFPMVTGVNENASGQYAPGRRSAYESRVVTQAASGRMRKVLMLLWESVFVPLSQTALANHRQGVDYDTFKQVLGEGATEEMFQEFKGRPEDIIKSYDLVTFDGTLPSDKLYLAQILQEIFSILMSNPEAAVQFNMNPKAVLDEMYRLRGAENLDRFAFEKEDLVTQLLPLIQQQLTNGTQPGPAQGAPPAAQAV